MDSACLALSRIAEAFSRSPEHLEALCALGLVSSILQARAACDRAPGVGGVMRACGGGGAGLWGFAPRPWPRTPDPPPDPPPAHPRPAPKPHARAQMVAVTPGGSMASQLQVSTFYGLLKLLGQMARASPVVAQALLQVREGSRGVGGWLGF